MFLSLRSGLPASTSVLWNEPQSLRERMTVTPHPGAVDVLIPTITRTIAGVTAIDKDRLPSFALPFLR